MTRLAILFSNPLLIRSWVDTGYLEALSRENVMSVFVLDESTGVKEALHQRGVDFELLSIEVTPLMKIIEKIQWVAGMGISDSLKASRDKYLFGPIQPFPKGLPISRAFPQFLKASWHFTQVLARSPFGALFSLFPLGKRTLVALTWIASHASFSQISLPKDFFEVLIIPSSGFEPWAAPLISVCRRKDIRTVIVPDNWDNITSKNSISVLPDALVTMGESMSKSLIQLGIPSEIIRPTGFPKFSSLGRSAKTKEFEIPRILYLGLSLAYFEVATLNLIYKGLKDKLDFEFEFFYKPHPAKKPRLWAEEDVAEGISILQPEMDPVYPLPVIDDDYIALLSSFDLVIAPPTTLLLEFLIAGRAQVLLDLSDDKVHRTTPALFSQRYLHVRDLTPLALPSGSTPQELIHQSLRLLHEPENLPHPELHKVICPNPQLYAHHLSKVARELITGPNAV